MNSTTNKQQRTTISLLFTLVERNVKPNERNPNARNVKPKEERKQENTKEEKKEEKKEKRVKDNFISIVKYNIYRIII